MVVERRKYATYTGMHGPKIGQRDCHVRDQVTWMSEPEAKRHKAMPVEQQLKLLVPANCAGAIIGKQGSSLKSIRESLGPQGSRHQGTGRLAAAPGLGSPLLDQGTGARVEVQPAVWNSVPRGWRLELWCLHGCLDSRCHFIAFHFHSRTEFDLPKCVSFLLST